MSPVDKYMNFTQLSQSEREGSDYQRLIEDRHADIVIIAPHGGGIEPGTSEIAKAIAGEEFSLYCFEGMKGKGNHEALHITSTRFDEPRCITLVTAACRAIAVHGQDSQDKTAFLGGRDEAMLKRLRDSLVAEGFNVQTDMTLDLQGRDKANICNRTQSKRGVQLELSNGLRSSFFQSLTRRGRKTRTERFEQFVAAVRQAILRPAEFSLLNSKGFPQ